MCVCVCVGEACNDGWEWKWGWDGHITSYAASDFTIIHTRSLRLTQLQEFVYVVECFTLKEGATIIHVFVASCTRYMIGA